MPATSGDGSDPLAGREERPAPSLLASIAFDLCVFGLSAMLVLAGALVFAAAYLDGLGSMGPAPNRTREKQIQKKVEVAEVTALAGGVLALARIVILASDRHAPGKPGRH
jgi:hypothetical protein